MKDILQKYLNPFREGEGGGSEPAPTPASPPPAKTWYEGADDLLRGHIQNRGWDKLTSEEAALAAVRAHKEAEGFIGTPAERVLRIPKDNTNPDEWNPVWARLGKPDAADKYDFSTLKMPDGKDVEPAFLDTLREAAFSSNLTQDQAVSYAKSVIKYRHDMNANTQAERETRAAEEAAKLKENWSTGYDANMVIARAGAEKVGVTPEQVAALEGVIGYAGIMEMFRKIGVSSGEAGFMAPLRGDPNAPMTKEGAKAQLEAYQNDAEWTKNFLAGGVKERRDFDKLTQIIAA